MTEKEKHEERAHAINADIKQRQQTVDDFAAYRVKLENQANPDKVKQIKITVSHPTVPESKKLTQEDVWGKWDEEAFKKLSDGMIIAKNGQTCPIWNDRVPYKSVTVVGPAELEADIRYWLEYVHGGESVSKRKLTQNGKMVALRSNYMCW